MQGPSRWLRELQAHPTHHPLLAAYALLFHLSQRPDHGPTPHSSHRPQGPNPGEASTIRFTHTAELALPLGELQAVTRDPTDPTRHLLTTAVEGPLGHDTPLPLALADELDRPLAHALLDLFHHRRTLLLCQGLLAADLAGTLDGQDPWSRRIFGLTGLTRLADRDPLAALRLAPIFINSDRSPRALNLALQRLLPELGPALQLRCEPRLEHRTPLAADQHTTLGGPIAHLGNTATLGHAVYLPGSGARLILGPVPTTARATLDPGGPAHALLRELLAAFICEPLDLELQLELEPTSLPPARLGQRALGNDLWLHAADRSQAPIRVPIPLTPRGSNAHNLSSDPRP